MKRFLKMLKENWTRVWLIAICLTMISFISIAAYTDVSKVKRVVSTTSSPGEAFSSNCMIKGNVSFQMSSDSQNVTVCNYPLNAPKSYSSSAISYSLTAELMVKVMVEQDDGSYKSDYKRIDEYLTLLYQNKVQANSKITDNKIAEYSIAKTYDDSSGDIVSPETHYFTDSNNYTYTFSSESLAPNHSSVDRYKVNIDPADKNEKDPLFFVCLTATAEHYSELSARLYRVNSTQSEDSTWKGEILEPVTATNTQGENVAVDYDFFNFILSGSGKGTVDILWNDNYLEINQFFLTENNLTPAEVSGNYTKKITLDVDSINKTNRYEIQLYKKQALVQNASAYIKAVFTSESNSAGS